VHVAKAFKNQPSDVQVVLSHLPSSLYAIYANPIGNSFPDQNSSMQFKMKKILENPLYSNRDWTCDTLGNIYSLLE